MLPILRRTLVLFSLLILLGGVTVRAARAQAAVNSFSALLVEMWPDYDRRSVLILYTITLPLEQPLPTTVTLPLPPNATINAVARFTSDGNNLIDDLFYTIDEATGTLTLTASAARLRVELYVPYEAVDLTRSYTWRWQAPVDVGLLSLSVQQPAAASSLTLDPPAASEAVNADGLRYHNFAPAAAPANTPVALTLRYTLASDVLTAVSDSSAPADTATANQMSSGAIAAIAFGSLGLLAVAAYLLWQRRATMRPARPRPQRPHPQRPHPQRPHPQQPRPQADRAPQVRAAPPSTSTVTHVVADKAFCPQCGQPVAVEDKFCRTCGTDLR